MCFFQNLLAVEKMTRHCTFLHRSIYKFDQLLKLHFSSSSIIAAVCRYNWPLSKRTCVVSSTHLPKYVPIGKLSTLNCPFFCLFVEKSLTGATFSVATQVVLSSICILFLLVDCWHSSSSFSSMLLMHVEYASDDTYFLMPPSRHCTSNVVRSCVCTYSVLSGQSSTHVDDSLLHSSSQIVRRNVEYHSQVLSIGGKIAFFPKSSSSLMMSKDGAHLTSNS